jgi:Holliday junction DNA helicase RuvA
VYERLIGEVVEKHPARVVLLVGGIGYELKVSVSTSSSLAVGQDCQLFAILHVVDGNPSLLGFATKSERDLARRMLSVSGVGPAMTLAILSTYSPEEVAGAIVRSESTVLQRVKGVGTKTAERLCLELRDAVAKMDLAEPGAGTTLLPQTADDAVAALLTLGYSEKEANKKVRSAYGARPESDTEELIKSVLRG